MNTDLLFYVLMAMFSVILDNFIIHFNIPILSVFLFINITGLYLIISRIQIVINIAGRENTT